MPSKKNPELLSAREVMAVLRIGRTTLWNWGRSGVLVPIPASPALKSPARYYRRADVEKLLPPGASIDEALTR